MYKKIINPFVIISLLLVSSFGLFDLEKAEAAYVGFAAATLHTTGVGPWGLDVADFDQDNNLDFVTSNPTGGDVSVFFGDGVGGFSSATTYTAGTQPRAVAAYDLDLDTYPDLIVSNRNSNNIYVYMNNGDGTFAAPGTVTCTDAPGCAPRYTAFGDLNGDTFPDMVIAASGNNASNGIVVKLGNGDGTFGASAPYPVSGTVNVFVKLYDLNHDNKLDIISAQELGDSLAVLLGVGDGTFGATTNLSPGDAPFAVDVGDFNGDTHPDIASISSSSAGVKIFLGDGTGAFTLSNTYLSGNALRKVAVEDYNQDGELDLAVANINFNAISVLTGVGDGTFNTADQIATSGTTPQNVVAADFNEDTWPDLVVANINSSNASVILNDPTQKDITSFTFGLPGESDDITGTAITITLPEGTDVTSLTPTIAITGVSVSPNTGVAQDFTNPVVYTVTALDASTKDYTVTVNLVPATITIITPSNGGTIRMATPLVATTDIASSCSYDLDSSGSVAFGSTGGTIHTSNVVGVTPGSHTIEVTCGSATETTTFTKQDPGEVVLYAINGTSGGAQTPNLYTIDPETGSITSTIGPTGHDIVSIAMDPTSGILYGGIDSTDVAGGAPYNLVSIDTSTGASTLLGAITSSGPVEHEMSDLAFTSAGVLYGWSTIDESVYTIDISSCNGVTCDAMYVGNTGTGSYGVSGTGITFDSGDNLYNTPLGDDYLVQLSPVDATITGFQSILNASGSSYPVGGLTADPKDRLFAVRRNYGSSPSDLVTITNTGSYLVSMGGDTSGLQYVTALAFSVDLNAPTLDIDLDDYALNDGDTALVTFTFSEPVIGFTNADITIDNGVLSTVSSSDGGLTWTATLTPTDDIEDATNVVSVDMTGVADLALNVGVGTAGSLNYTIDTLEPAAPVSSLEEGVYKNTRSLTLSSTGSTSIRYTTDGTTPSCSVGTIYTGTVEIGVTTTLQAVGCDDVGNTSNVASFDYIISISSGGSSGGGLTRPKATTPTPTTTQQPASILGSGQCSTELIITQNLRQGARDGKFESYSGGTVSQVKVLQAHINRILAAQYSQAAGPVDGIFGPLTKQGVQRLQVALNDVVRPVPPLKIDGIVGPFTKAAINNSCGQQ